jgi:flagellar assembly protein FliH
MATILRTTDSRSTARGAAFNFEDLAAQANAYLAQVRADGAALVAQAHAEADAVRQQAEEEGHAAALRAAQGIVGQQLLTLLPALRKAVADIQDARQAWLARWEAGGVRLATAIAQRLIRRELQHCPEITLDLLRESLELAAGGSQVCIRLNPADHKALGAQVRKLVKELSPLGEVELKSDVEITAGGCRVDTRFGVIDQQFESQLKRIEEELLP